MSILSVVIGKLLQNNIVYVCCFCMNNIKGVILCLPMNFIKDYIVKEI